MTSSSLSRRRQSSENRHGHLALTQNQMVLSWTIFSVLLICVQQCPLVSEGYGVSGEAAAPPSEGQEAPRIFGGFQPESMKRYPYQVALLNRTATGGEKLFCGGTIIDSKYILTAGHCFARYRPGVAHTLPRNSISIRYGNVDHTLGTKIEVQTLWVHPRFTQNPSIRNDVAVLKLKTPISFSSSARPILLAPEDNQLAAGSDLIVSGWGWTTEEGPIVKKLRATVIDYLPNICGRSGVYGNKFVPSVMMCAGCGTGNKKTCKGDSGGPVVARSASGGCPILVGIVSWGYFCGMAPYPSIFTRVSSVVDWVEGVVRKPVRSAAQLSPSTACRVCGTPATSRCAPGFDERRCASEASLSPGFSLSVAKCRGGYRVATASLVSPPSSFKAGKVFFLRSTEGAGNAVVKVNGVKVNVPLKAPVQVSAPVSSKNNKWQFAFRTCSPSGARYAAVYFANGVKPVYKVSLSASGTT